MKDNTGKTFKQMNRRYAQVRNAEGVLIDFAFGRKAIWEMKVRHGFSTEAEQPKRNDGCDNLPTGFENE